MVVNLVVMVSMRVLERERERGEMEKGVVFFADQLITHTTTWNPMQVWQICVVIPQASFRSIGVDVVG